MKKILVMIVAVALLSCDKNNYKEMTNDMEKIVNEEKKTIEVVEPIYNGLSSISVGKLAAKTENQYLEELKIVDVENIKKLNEKFKNKYSSVKLDSKTGYEESCAKAREDYVEYVDVFLKMFEEYKAGAIAKEKQFSWPVVNLRSNVNSQEGLLRSCRLVK